MLVREFCLASASTQIEIKKGYDRLYSGSTNDVPKDLNYRNIIRIYPMYDSLMKEAINIVYVD